MSAEVATSATPTDKPTQPLVGEELKQALKKQVEFYFSKGNLANDAFLVSQMNSQMYVPVKTILSFSKIQEMTTDANLLLDAISDSTVCSVNETKDAIKPNIKSERNTIILREIPSSTDPSEVEKIFEGSPVKEVRSDVGDTWFVTMDSEDAAVQTLLNLRSKTFNNAPIKARLKSENILRSFYPSQPSDNTAPVNPNAVGGSGPVVSAAQTTAYGPRGYYGAAPMGYYEVQSTYGNQYNIQRGPRSQGYNGRGGRGGFRGRGYQANANGQPREGRNKSNSFDQRSGRGKKQDKKEKGSPAPKRSDKQPVLNVANFPPLPTAAEKAADASEITYQYAHDDIMEIVKHMDESELELPAGKMDYAAHDAALTSVAHPDLLRNQRTYSIEQAREAMRQGRPVRSDSVGSADYESMMYGEDYTREVRAARSQEKPAEKQEEIETEVAPKEEKTTGYANAVINGTPASPPQAKKTEKSDKVEKTERTEKTEKKGEKKEKKSEKSEKKEKVEAPKGAWGGRNFLDVVKSEPTGDDKESN